MKLSHLLGGAAVAALIAGYPTTAFAQSTGTQEVEKVTVTGERGGKGGVIVKEQRPKSRSTVSSEYIDSQAGGQSIFQSINLLPGIVFTNSDPYGSSGGAIRQRGFDGQQRTCCGLLPLEHRRGYPFHNGFHCGYLYGDRHNCRRMYGRRCFHQRHHQPQPSGDHHPFRPNNFLYGRKRGAHSQ